MAAKRPAAKRVAAEKPAKKRIATKKAAKQRIATRNPARKLLATRKPAKKWSGRRLALPRPHLPAISWAKSLAILAAIVAALGAGYFLWFRDSSLVAVTEVRVEGVRSGDKEQITTQLTRAAEEMTTLHVRPDRLEAVAGSFPTIESVRADASFPHGLRIEVTERPPTMVASVGGEETSVAADGTLLPGIEPAEGLPRLELDALPPAGQLEGEPLEQALAVGAAPEELLSLIERIGYSEAAGVELRMRGGVELRFGSGARAPAKWAAAAAVLADPELESATYVDVRVPERPAVGGSGVEPPAEATEVPAVVDTEAPVSTGG